MFEKIIGYENEKAELAKFCDVITNIDYYKSLGITIPKGILLYGNPGLGKTTFAYSIIEACNRPYYVLRKNADTSQFIKNIRDTFKIAEKNAPSIILLDDMDKYGDGQTFCQEYTSLQGAIDDYKNSDIFLIATVNDFYKLPISLTRSGRFDQIIYIQNPKNKESSMITNYYLDSKHINLDPSIDRDLVGRLLNGCSCATIEVVINTAAIYSVYKRQQYIYMEDIIDAVLTIVYNRPKVYNDDRSDQEKYMLATHEAGKAIIEYLLKPEQLSFVTIREKASAIVSKKTTDADGPSYDILYDKYLDNSTKSFSEILNDIVILLSGKTCFEMKFNMYDTYSSSDTLYASILMDDIFYNTGMKSFPDVINREGARIIRNDGIVVENDTSTTMSKDDLARYCIETSRRLLADNWWTVECAINMLMQKDTLTVNDIRDIFYYRGGVVSNNQLGCVFNNLIERRN
jgi:cell division protease FtsH